MIQVRLFTQVAVLVLALAACSASVAPWSSSTSRIAPWDHVVPATGYPGAAALVSESAASVPAEKILPPVLDPHSDMPRYWLDNCLDARDSATEKVCYYGDTRNPVLTVAMVGGSADGNWFPALEQIARQRHWKLVTDLHGTCEWTDAMLYQAALKQQYIACYQWGQAALKDLETTIKPDVVIAGGYPEDGTVAYPVATSAGSIAAIAAGEATYWTDLVRHGIAVVAMRETPVPDFSLADCVLKNGRGSSKCMVPVARAILADSPNVAAARDTGGKVPVIDMNRFICGPAECAPVVGNVLVYFDGRHLTATYSRSLTPYLLPRLLAAAPVLARS